MKLYAPKYYNQFKCIADKCEHSCCIGWEIDIDDGALEGYKALECGYGKIINDSISFDGTPHFKLCEGDRCPHLDEKGLCRIILNVGEDHLCGICREHPRFYNYTDVAEVGLGMSCREAARLVLSSTDYAKTEEIGNVDGKKAELTFNGRIERARVYSILQSDGIDYCDKLQKIHSEYEIELLDDAFYIDLLSELEYLDEAHRELFMNYSADKRAVGTEAYLERALAYFVYRHCTEALDSEDFRARLAFCLFCERLLSSLAVSQGVCDLNGMATLASIISEEIEYSEDNTESLTC
ncbi:MAG: flagellin lysine-N-methylase [Clostridia bacterium]|nr:flagellin lysine-N-methylase [Clostridia bacterium]